MAGTLNVAGPRSDRERAYIKDLSREWKGECRRTSVRRNVCARFAEYCGGDVRPARYSHEYDKDAVVRSYVVARRNGGVRGVRFFDLALLLVNM